MRETDFIKQNIKKWFEFEQTLNNDSKDPDQLSKSFIEITDDLSYARSFYPNRSVRVYLNGVAQKITQDLYKIKKPKWYKLKNFFLEDIPAVVYHSKKPMFFSLAVFGCAVIIGVVSSIYDKNFATTILGSEYVNMTEENIKSNDPMGVYKNQSQLQMMLYIGWNNIRIAFQAFVMGALCGIGTLGIMLSNGIMLGTFQYFFYERGFFTESFLTIWLHGVPEIGAIIISGGCGFTLAQGLIFPGTFSRVQSFRIGAYRALKIMVALVIVLTFAAFVESFVTRYTEIPQWVRGIFILLELIILVGYFVALPIVKHKKFKNNFLADEKFSPPDTIPLDFKNIKSNGEIFSMLFQFYKTNFSSIFKTIIISVTIFTGYILFNIHDMMYDNFEFGLNYYFYTLNFIRDESNLYFLIASILAISLLLFFVTIKLKLREEIAEENMLVEIKNLGLYVLKYLWQTAIIVFIMYSILLLPPAAMVFVSLLAIPFLLFWNYIIYKEEKNIISAIPRTLNLLGPQLGKVYGLFSVLLLLCTVFFLLLSSPIISMNTWAIGLHISLDQTSTNMLLKIFLFLVVNLTFALIIPILVLGVGFAYYSVVETHQATNLKERINKIGTTKKYFGLARENN
jgi:uncharacterized membrane protein SpoIIM required for sporulation